MQLHTSDIVIFFELLANFWKKKKKKKFEAEKFDCTMNRQVGGDWSRKGEESNRGEADLSSDREYLF